MEMVPAIDTLKNSLKYETHITWLNLRILEMDPEGYLRVFLRVPINLKMTAAFIITHFLQKS